MCEFQLKWTYTFDVISIKKPNSWPDLLTNTQKSGLKKTVTFPAFNVLNSNNIKISASPSKKGKAHESLFKRKVKVINRSVYAS